MLALDLDLFVTDTLAAVGAVSADSMMSNQWELRGNNALVQEMRDEEILLVGAAGTGKTLAWLKKIHTIASTYPGARIAIIRKVRADLAQTVLVTFERDVLGLSNPICSGMQRKTRDSYRYPNGSEIVVGGMDRPGKILGGEYHIIYLNEAVEFSLNDWEFFVMRLGRDGVVPFAQLIADTNPAYPTHWLKQRAEAGATKLLNSYHKDNPAYWDADAETWTERGIRYVQGKLERLTGIRRARFLEGKWVQAEGAVYEEWADNTHVIEPFDIPADWRRFRAIDFGYSNPFVCLWIAQDHDGRMYIYRELYMTQRLVEDHARQIVLNTGNEQIEFTTADHDAEDRATLERHGVTTVTAEKAISSGIQAVKERLRVAGDGRPRLFYMRGSLIERDPHLMELSQPLSVADEMSAYVWAKNVDGKPNKEMPVDLYNHGLDALRYAVVAADGQHNIDFAAAPDDFMNAWMGRT